MTTCNFQKKSVDIAFCYPLFDKVFFTEPVGIISLLAYLKERGYSVYIETGFLSGYDIKTTANSLIKIKPSVIGISMNCAREVEDGLKLIETLRSSGFTGFIAAGGDFAGFHKKILLSGGHVNAVIIGEGEVAIVELLETLFSNGDWNSICGLATPKNPTPVVRSNIPALNILPYLDRSVLCEMIKRNGLSTKGIQATVPTSRGCYGGCAFCSVSTGARTNSGARFREFSVERVVAEMHDIFENYQINDFYLCSAQFLPRDKKSAELKSFEFMQAVKALPFTPSMFLYIRCDNITVSVAYNLAKAGVSTVFIGVESFDDYTLKMLHKGLTSAEIQAALFTMQKAGYACDYRAKLRMKLGFIMFTPWIELEGLRTNLHACKKFGIPPKKMVYTLQLHESNDFSDDVGSDYSLVNIEFAKLSDEAVFVRKGYIKVLSLLSRPLEVMRAYQKARLPIADELYIETWDVVDNVNKYAYHAFEMLIDLAADKNEESFNQVLEDTAAFVQTLKVNELVKKMRLAAPPERLECVQSHLERGLDNPQLFAQSDDTVLTPRCP